MAKTMDRSILARSLMTGAASLAFMMMGPAGVRADIVIVQGDDAAPPVAALTRPNGAPAALSTWEVSQVPHNYRHQQCRAGGGFQHCRRGRVRRRVERRKRHRPRWPPWFDIQR